MRYSILLVISLYLLLPFQLWSKHATVEVSLGQTSWNAKTKELHFDWQLKAVDKPFYLSFSDLVLALPKSALDMNALKLTLIPGSTQLFNLGEEVLDFPGVVTKLRAGKDTVYFIVQLMPNQFSDLSDFFERNVHINTMPGFNRVGRFTISGVVQLPETLKPHFAAKGPGSLILAFDPKNEFRAVELTEKWLVTKPAMEALHLFEVQSTDEQIIFSWKWQLSKQAWTLWGSVDAQNWTLIKEGKGGEGFKSANKPNTADGYPQFKAFRMTYINEKGLEQSVYRFCIN